MMLGPLPEAEEALDTALATLSFQEKMGLVAAVSPQGSNGFNGRVSTCPASKRSCAAASR
jgi:hypothetical protein